MEKKKKIRGDDPRLKERKKMSGERTLDIEGSKWGWVSGSRNILIIDPSGNRKVVPREELGHVETHGPRGSGDDPTVEIREVKVVSTGDIVDYIHNNLLEGWKTA